MSDTKTHPGHRMLRVGVIYLVAFGGTYLALRQFTDDPEGTPTANVSMVLSNVLPTAMLLSALLVAIGLFLTLRNRSDGLAASDGPDV